MVFEVEFRDGGGPSDIEETLSGVPTEDGFRLLNERVVSDPRFRAGLTILVDCSALNTSGLSSEDLQRFSQHMVMRDLDYPPGAVAFIAPDEEMFNKMQEFRAHLGGSRSKRQLFRDRADAVAWLEEQTAES